MPEPIQLSVQARRIASSILIRDHSVLIDENRLTAICAELKGSPPSDPELFLDELFALMAKVVRLAEGDWQTLATQLITIAAIVGGNQGARGVARAARSSPEAMRALLGQPRSAVPGAVTHQAGSTLLNVRITQQRK